MKKHRIAALLLAVLMLAVTGCGGETTSSQEEEAKQDAVALELCQNDFRGGIVRTFTFKDGVLAIMEDMKANNNIIRGDNPNSYWTTDGYQDFVSTFLEAPIIYDTRWFTEEQCDWGTVCNQIATTDSSFTVSSDEGYSLKNGISIVRNEKDDYSIKGTTDTVTSDAIGDNAVYSGTANYRILYDCDKDWCKAYTSLRAVAELPPITTQFFEYQRVDNNTFLIQTSRERLMIVLEPSEADTDLRERKIKEYYYSKLVSEGQRTTFEPYQPLPETDAITGSSLASNINLNELMKANPKLNEKGDFALRYGLNDSVFYKDANEFTRDWVFEDKSLQQAIVYKDGIFIVTTYNKLSTNYERFIYALQGAKEEDIKELENIVVIDNLIGTQITELKPVVETEVEAVANTAPTTTATVEEETPVSETETAETQPVAEG